MSSIPRGSFISWRTKKDKLPLLLIVDDQPALQILLKQFFKDRFISVGVVNGKECMKYLETEELPELIILDLDMPEMGGMEVIKAIRNNRIFDNIAIVVLSSKESSEDRIKCLKSGADDFVVKPFNPTELDARIEAILRRINS